MPPPNALKRKAPDRLPPTGAKRKRPTQDIVRPLTFTVSRILNKSASSDLSTRGCNYSQGESQLNLVFEKMESSLCLGSMTAKHYKMLIEFFD
jgi:hypothetical protein